MSCLYILEIKSLSVTSFANIFSQFLSCFCLVYGLLCFTKHISLTGSHLFSFAFISIAFGEWPKKTLLKLISKSILLMFPSNSLMMSCLISKSFIPFEFVFVYDVRVFSNFVFTCDCPTFPTPHAELFSPLSISPKINCL